MSSTSVSARPGHISTVSANTRPKIYVGLTALMAAVVAVGFWPSYFGQLIHGLPDRPWIIHVHGAVFVGWMTLLAVQVGLAATGRVRAHRKLGSFGIAYGFLVLILGLIAGFAAPVIHFSAGEWSMDQAAGFLLLILGDMVLFGGFFIGAIVYRRQPEVHKRLMVLATVALVFAGAGRMEYLAMPVRLAIWLSPVVAGMVYDRVTRGSVHRTYWVGLAVLVVLFARVFLLESEAWLRIGRPLLGIFI